MTELIVVNLLLFIGAYVQGLIGFGIGLLCAPILAIYMPAMVPTTMILNSIVLSCIMCFRGAASVDSSIVKWPILGNILGVACAAAMIAAIPAGWFDVLLGLLLLALVFMTAAKNIPVNRNIGAAAGYLSGFMGTITAVGGPPMALVFKQYEPKVIRANLAVFFLISSLCATVALYLVDKLTMQHVKLFLLTCPGMLVGYYLSQKSNAIDNPKLIANAILVISFVASVYVVFKGLIKLGAM